MNKSGTAVTWIVIAIVVAVLIVTYIVAQGINKGNKVVLETTKGNVVIQLYKDMPVTSGNFEQLVQQGFYDGVLFHRVIDGFMIQAGDPLTKNDSLKARWGTGGPGYTIKDEFNDASNVRGTIAMANAGPNTGGSQFFINQRTEGNVFLDGRHPVFGEVVEGMDVVDAIASVETDSQDRPLEEVRIISARVV